MAMKRWVQVALGGAAGLILLFVVVAGAGVWYMSRSLAAAVKVGDQVPAVQLADLTGQAVELSAYRGKVLVIDFWNSG